MVVEDNADMAVLLETTLRGIGHRVTIVPDGGDAVAQATAMRPDLVLLDSGLPGMTGRDVCRSLRADFTTASAGIIFVTASADNEDIVSGFEAGADDYISKPFQRDELLARVSAVLRRARELRGLSPLTGLPGNFVILREIKDLVESATTFALIYADLDNFKAYNDRYGFLRGDDAISTTARVLCEALETSTGHPRFLGHVGGDDFVMLVAPSDASGVARTVVAKFDAAAPSLYDQIDRGRGYIELTDRRGSLCQHNLLRISLGIATTETRVYSSPHEVVAVATEMKALAKREQASSWQVDRRSST